MSNERLNIIEETRINGAPDIVIEILSANNAYCDLKHKKKTYKKNCVKEYWIVDPIDKDIEIYENIDKKYHLICDTANTGAVKSNILKELVIDIKEIF